MVIKSKLKINLLVIFTILLLLSVNISFGETNIKNSFVNFKITFNNFESVATVNATLNLKDTNNYIPLSIVRKSNYYEISNLEPFMDAGEYCLNVMSKSIYGNVENVKKCFYYRNYNSLPPAVPMLIYSNKTINGDINEINNTICLQINKGTPECVKNYEDHFFKFSPIKDKLNEPVSLVEFYTDINGLNSTKIKRVVYKNIPKEDFSLKVNNINLDFNSMKSLNSNTAYDSNKKIFYTSRADFYVTGTSNSKDGAVIFVNGVKALVYNNHFGAVIYLNKGNNTIYVENKDGSVVKKFNVTFIPVKFMFIKINLNRFTDKNSVTINGETTTNNLVYVYLNDKLVKKIMPENKKFSLTLNNLRVGKNFLDIEGKDFARYFTIIYYVKDEPKITLENTNQITNNSKFIFKINDSIGIIYDTLKVKLNDKTYTNKNFVISGDYFVLNNSGIGETGSVSYSIEARDYAGRTLKKTGTLTVNNNVPCLGKIYIGNKLNLFGKILFLHYGENHLVIKPNKFIAFKSIYIDGKRVTNYKINYDKSIDLTLNVSNPKGVVTFDYIDFNHHLYKENFVYYSSLNAPELKLDFVYDFYGSINKPVLVTGEVDSLNFDWSTFSINGQKTFKRFGKYFEAKIIPNSNSNLEFSGVDIFGNQLRDNTFGKILYNNNNHMNYERVIKYLNMGFLGHYYTPKFLSNVISYENIPMLGSPLMTDFILSPSQKEGLSNIKLKTYNAGFFEDYNKIYVLDSLKPKVIPVKDGTNYYLILDGTESPILVNEINLTQNGEKLNVQLCNNLKLLPNQICVKINSQDIIGKNIIVYAEDSAYNNITVNLKESDFKPLQLNKDEGIKPRIFTSGNNLYTKNDTIIITGNYISNNNLVNIYLDNKKCEITKDTFACEATNLQTGKNNLKIVMKDSSGKDLTSTNIEIIRLGPLKLNIDKIYGNDLFKINDVYYLTGDYLYVNGSVNNESLITALVNNNEEDLCLVKGNFNFKINLSEEINNKETDNINLRFKAKSINDNGYTDVSKEINIIFNRIVKTFIKIFVY